MACGSFKTEDSEEHIVLTSDGARIARTVRVFDEAVAKEKAMWLHVCGVPWDPRKASHPDGKKMQKVQPVPIILPSDGAARLGEPDIKTSRERGCRQVYE